MDNYGVYVISMATDDGREIDRMFHRQKTDEQRPATTFRPCRASNRPPSRRLLAQLSWLRPNSDPPSVYQIRYPRGLKNPCFLRSFSRMTKSDTCPVVHAKSTIRGIKQPRNGRRNQFRVSSGQNHPSVLFGRGMPNAERKRLNSVASRLK